MEEATKSSENRKTFYIVLIIVLILLNAFFAFNHWSAKKESMEIEAQRNELDSLYTNVLSELNTNQIRLDSLRGQNGELDSLLVLRNSDLEATKNQIEELIKQGKITSNELSKARKLIKSLKEENNYYIAKIDTLTEQVVFLTGLSDSLTTDLLNQKDSNQVLRSERVILSQKVKLGSLLRPESVTALGVRYKSNGKEIETTSAKKSEKLRFCFTIPENKVADAGQKSLLLRLLGPSGSTIAVNSGGSGIFTVNGTDEEKQYTTKIDFDYENQSKNICMYWAQTSPFGKGNYKALFYQDGYLLTEKAFDLK